MRKTMNLFSRCGRLHFYREIKHIMKMAWKDTITSPRDKRRKKKQCQREGHIFKAHYHLCDRCKVPVSELATFEKRDKVIDNTMLCIGCGGYKWHSLGEQQPICDGCIDANRPAD